MDTPAKVKGRERKPSKVFEIVEHKAEVMADRTIAPIVSRIYHESWIYRKGFWIFCYLACWTIFLVTTYALWVNYRRYDTNAELSVSFSKEIVFPAVTVCDQNSLNKFKATVAKDFYDLSQADDALWVSVFEILANSSDVDFDINLQPSPCSDDEFQCDSGNCIDQFFLCDNYADCITGEDERNELCANRYNTFGDLTSMQKTQTCPLALNALYNSTDWSGSLKNVTHCCDWKNSTGKFDVVLPPWAVCDGYYHCTDKSDEAYCDFANDFSVCPRMSKIELQSDQIVKLNPDNNLCMDLAPSDFVCSRWCKDKCLEMFQVCDGTEDCPNGLDESRCVSDMASPTNKPPINETAFVDNAWSAIDSSPDMSSEAGVFIANNLSLYEQLTLTAQKDPYYSAVKSKLVPKENSIADYGVPRESLIKLCSYNNRACSGALGKFDYFWKSWKHTVYGNCHTFNHLLTNFSRENQNKISSTGYTSGLHVTLSVDEDAYIPLMSPGVGAIIGVNPHYEHPQPEYNTVLVKPGTGNLLSLKKNTISKLGGLYSGCITEYPEFVKNNEMYLSAEVKPFLKSYDLHFCIQICMALQPLACETGACRYGYILDRALLKSQTIPDCDLTKREQFDCYQEAKERVTNSSNCGCVQGCNREIFSQFLSSSQFPAKAYVPFLLNSILETDEDVLNFKDHNKWALNVVEALRDVRTSMTDEIADNVTRILRKSMIDVNVYMDSLYIDTIKESPAYTVIDLLADFGGNSGLYVGFCALSLFEVLEFIWDVTSAVVKRKLLGIVAYYERDDDDNKKKRKNVESAI